MGFSNGVDSRSMFTLFAFLKTTEVMERKDEIPHFKSNEGMRLVLNETQSR
jgi:hypothetical protein